MGCIYDFAENELNILQSIVPDSIASNYRNEILAIANKFESEKHLGASASFTAHVLGNVIRDLLLFRPITPIMDEPDQWIDYIGNGSSYQHRRDSRVFKENNKCFFIEGLVFVEEATNEDGDKFDLHFTSNHINTSSHGVLRSRQTIRKFPFFPQTFIVRVQQIDEDLYEVLNPEILDKVKEYYD